MVDSNMSKNRGIMVTENQHTRLVNKIQTCRYILSFLI